eukprot:c7656_g1_i1 orf=177-2726(-)
MCAKQVLQSFFRSRRLSEPSFARCRGCPSSTTCTFNAYPHNHAIQSPTHASSLKPSHVRASQALQEYKFAHYVCMSTRVLRCHTTIRAHAMDAYSDAKHAKPCLAGASSINSGLFRIQFFHNGILAQQQCVYCPSIYKSLPMHARLQNGKYESLAHTVYADSEGKYAKNCPADKLCIYPGLFRSLSPQNGILDKPRVYYTPTFKYLSKHASLLNGKHDRGRNFCMEALDDKQEQLPQVGESDEQREISTCVPQTSTKQTTDLNVSAVAEKVHVVENGIMLRQDDFMLKADNIDSLVTEESSEDDTLEESTDDEKEFYDLIEAEDSVDELLSMLINLEETFPSSDSRICRTCLRLAKLCNDTNENPEKILDYARKAFHNFDSSRFPIESAKSLFLVGIGHFKMGELKQAVASLESCVLMMEKLGVPLAKQQELATLQYSVQIGLGQAKISLGWNHEGVLDFEKGLTAMEKILPPDSPHLASRYQQIAEAYMQAKKPKEALILCNKALSICMKCFGPSSSEVAEIRSFMLQLYYELNDFESVLCECELAAPVLETLGKFDEATSLELESMPAFFHLGKLHEAVTKLNEIITRTKEEDPLYIEALIFLVRAFNDLKDDTAAAKYCQKALNALENKNLTLESAKTLVRLSMVYEKLQNYDQALAVLRRALEFFEHSMEKEAATVAADVEGFTGFLLLSIGRPKEAIPHLERCIARKKNIYGSESGELLDACNHLGVAYAHAEKVDEALAVFRAAKLILNKNNDGAGLMSIYIHNNLSLTCSLSGRIDEAIEFKKHAINSMRKASKQTSFSLDEAEEELEALVQATKHGKAASKSNDQMLRRMLTSCTQAHAIN